MSQPGSTCQHTLISTIECATVPCGELHHAPNTAYACGNPHQHLLPLPPQSAEPSTTSDPYVEMSIILTGIPATSLDGATRDLFRGVLSSMAGVLPREILIHKVLDVTPPDRRVLRRQLGAAKTWIEFRATLPRSDSPSTSQVASGLHRGGTVVPTL